MNPTWPEAVQLQLKNTQVMRDMIGILTDNCTKYSQSKEETVYYFQCRYDRWVPTSEDSHPSPMKIGKEEMGNRGWRKEALRPSYRINTYYNHYHHAILTIRY